MAIANSWVFTKTIFESEKFLENTGNIYRLVSQRSYVNKKDPSKSGVTVSLQVTQDTTDYGVDKRSGLPRDNNILNVFDVTILNGKDRIDVKKGDYVKLIEFIPEETFIVNFDVILRFRDIEKINVKTK